MGKYEYKIILLQSDKWESWELEFNNVGEDGWELVQIIARSYAIFKRPKEEEPADTEEAVEPAVLMF